MSGFWELRGRATVVSVWRTDRDELASDFIPVPAMPADDADEVEWLLFQQDGVLTRGQAAGLIGKGRLQRHLDRGRWRLAARGVVVTHTGPLTPAQQRWVAVLAARPGAVIAGLAAAALEGLRGWRRPVIDVLVPAPRQVRAPVGDRVRRTTRLSDVDVRDVPPPRTVAARSLVDAAQWAGSDDEARAILAAGCQQRRTTPEDLAAAVARQPRARRRALIRQTIADIAGGAEALSEINLVRLCRRHGLPIPDQRVRRTDAEGRQRYLDAYWHEFYLHVEVDGAHHMDVRQWWADLHRQNQLWIGGDRVLRFPAWVVRTRPVEVAAQLRAALRAAGWHG